MAQLIPIFLNVIVPVFALVVVGYYAGPKLQLDARTLSRYSYYILIPCFVFDTLSNAKIEAALALRMTLYAFIVHLGCALLGFILAKILRRDPKMIAAYMAIAIFGNVGNFGLPMIKFRFPDEPNVLEISTLYFLAIMSISFVVNVAVANWHKGGSWKAALAVVKTPALIAVPPALIVNYFQMGIPPMITRPISLLAAAMIPTMIVALGVQLASAGLPKINSDMIFSSAIRLIGGPILAFALAMPFGVEGLGRSVGIIQAAMPTAVLTSIIAFENDLIPEFVTATVLFSTVASIITLTIVLALV